MQTRYLHVGDPLVGMPVGGYRSNSFTAHASFAEYVRDAGRVVYSAINVFYTYDEVRDSQLTLNLIAVVIVYF